MHKEDVMKTLDQIARAEGYLAASRLEHVLAAVAHAGIDFEDIEVIQRKGVISIKVVAYRGPTDLPVPDDDQVRRDPVVQFRQ